MDKLKGSMDTLSAMQITEDTRGLDAECKTILYKKEVLAVILQGVITEYKGYSRQEVLEFIEDDLITRTMEVSPGRTNTETRGSNTEFIHLNEKTSNFDLAFQAKNPLLSDEGYELLRFLNAILYPHKQNFMSVISDYIDFSENEELWKEVTGVSSWFDVVYEGTKDDAKKAVMVEVEEEKRLAREEIEEEKKLAREEIEEEKRLAREGAEKEKRLAREEGIQAVVIDNLEEQIPKERIILKLQKHFKLSEEESEQYYNKFTVRTF